MRPPPPLKNRPARHFFYKIIYFFVYADSAKGCLLWHRSRLFRYCPLISGRERKEEMNDDRERDKDVGRKDGENVGGSRGQLGAGWRTDERF
jgi:hypothetical protein